MARPSKPEKPREPEEPGTVKLRQLRKLQQGLRARLNDWRGLPRRQPIQGRQIIRKLLVGRLTMTPRAAES